MFFSYRLAPKHTFPAQFHDCYAIIKTLLATGGQYGIDSNRIVVAGDSAGGNLAAAVALKLRDENKKLAAQVRTDLFMACVVPEKMHTHPMEGHWKFLGGGGS